MGAFASKKKSSQKEDDDPLRAMEKALFSALKAYKADFLTSIIMSYIPQPTTDLKVVMWGNGGVGKSALTLRFVTGMFEGEYDPTIEDSYRKQVSVDGRVYLLDILDTAGREEFTSMQDVWIREGQIFLICYSITNRSSWDEVESYRNRLLRTKEDQDGPFALMLAATKCDLEESRVVSTAEATQKAKEWNVPFLETSAKTRINDEEVYYEAIRQFVKQRK